MPRGRKPSPENQIAQLEKQIRKYEELIRTLSEKAEKAEEALKANQSNKEFWLDQLRQSRESLSAANEKNAALTEENTRLKARLFDYIQP